jgi:DNA-binding transcriptional LysR family regulator
LIDKLNYVIALAREQHFGRAALACGVTQPTMSAGLKQLEDVLGVVIVRRSSRFQGFTPEGEHVLSWARRIVGDAQAMRQDLDALKRGLAGHIRLAVIPTALAMVPELTTPFRDHHPSVRFSIESSSSMAILERLSNLDIDGGITYLADEPLGDVKTVPLYRESYALLTSADGTLGQRDRVGWSDLGDLPLCLMTPDMQNRRIIDQMLRDGGASPDTALQSNSLITLIAHVATGRWSSIVPSGLAPTIGLPPGIRAIPIGGSEVTHLVGLVVPQRYEISPLTNALVREAERLAARHNPTKSV